MVKYHMPTKKRECGILDKPSLGLALIFAFIGFGADRFYVGQVGLGIVLLISYITVIGLILAFPIQFLTQLSLVIAIFANRTTTFMYGNQIEFAPPTLFDKVIGGLWVALILVSIFLIPTVAALNH